ncbi:AMP-binding protein, partial [Streptomyces sp. SID1328]|uniref:AMP-binding protein n=1 Tax=Streptomyces sp. SID1328 TaxID=2690250 RepID=UPI0013684270
TDTPAPRAASDAPVELHSGDTLPVTVLDELRRLAGDSRTTWTAVLVSAVAAYVARVTGTRDVRVGLASHGRHAGLRHIMGMTSNILPLRLAVTPDMTVGALVRAVAAEMRGAMRHRRFSREQLARELNLADDGARLTDVVVNIMGFEYGLDFGGSAATSRLLSIGPVDDVSLFVSERSEGQGPLIGFDTNPELYHPDDVRLHQDAVVSFLTALAGADAETPLAEIPLLDDTATAGVLAQGRGAELPAGDTALPQAFAAQVRRAPDAPAVVAGAHTLTYRELAEAADELSGALSGWGVGAEDGVGVLVDRSAAVVTATLGAVGAGAAYVPMDAAWPAGRLDRVAGTARVRALIVDAANADADWVTERAATLPVLVV